MPTNSCSTHHRPGGSGDGPTTRADNVEAVEPGETRTGYEYDNGDVVRIRSEGPGTDRDDRFTYDVQGL